MEQETTCTKHVMRRKVAVTLLCLSLFAGALAVVGCSPQGGSGTSAPSGADKPAQTEQTDDSATPDGFSTVNTVDFTNTSTGLFPDTYTNRMLNTGNRGCNSCHVDLWQTTSHVMATEAERTDSAGGHIDADGWTHYNRKGTVLDCIGCHSGHIQNTGPYYGDTIHSLHYQSQDFLSNNGNCWNCHAVSSDEIYTDTDDYELLLWEELMYSPKLGGYPTLAESPETRFFIEHRGFSDYNLSEMSVDENPNITVDMSQPLTDIEDIYIINNHVFDYSVLKPEISVSGVVNPKTFTTDELKALPQKTVTVTEECVLNDINGMLVANIEATGPTLAEVVDACGGFADGATNTMVVNCYDDWSKTYQSEREFLENTVLALQYNGKDITEQNGYPAVIVIPGCHGGMWNKHVSEIVFSAEEEDPPDAIALFFEWEAGLTSTTTFNKVNTGWFDNDGKTFSMSEGVTLEGYGFAWQYYGAMKNLKFSTDMGVTWQTFDIPADFDPLQWDRFTFHWQPPAPGTYIIKVAGENDKGEVMKDPGCASIIVKVTE